MRVEHVELLVCPTCGGRLVLEPFDASGAEVVDGALACAGGHTLPIIGGIPRFTTDAAREHEACWRKYGDQFEIGGPKDAPTVWKRTRESFGLQWLTYDVIEDKEDRATFFAKTGLREEALADTLVLDVGCGGGRYARVAAACGARVVAVDLSRACEKARPVLSPYPETLVIQGNLMSLPFVEGSFDAVYSIGVLHHTPDTHAALEAISRFVRPGGTLSVWIYAKRDPVFEAVNRLLRGITTRMSYPALMRLARLAVPVGALKRAVLSRRRLAWTSKLLPPCSSHPDPVVRACDTFDWYSPEFQWHHTDEELSQWLRELGFADLVNLSRKEIHHRFQGEGVNFRAVRNESPSR